MSASVGTHSLAYLLNLMNSHSYSDTIMFPCLSSRNTLFFWSRNLWPMYFFLNSVWKNYHVTFLSVQLKSGYSTNDRLCLLIKKIAHFKHSASVHDNSSRTLMVFSNQNSALSGSSLAVALNFSASYLRILFTGGLLILTGSAACGISGTGWGASGGGCCTTGFERRLLLFPHLGPQIRAFYYYSIQLVEWKLKQCSHLPRIQLQLGWMILLYEKHI